MSRPFKATTAVFLLTFTCWLGAGPSPAPAQGPPSVAQWNEAIAEMEGVLGQCYEAKADASLDLIAALDALGLVPFDQQANILATVNVMTQCIIELENLIARARGEIDDLEGNPLASFMLELEKPTRACPPPIPPNQALQLKLHRIDRILAGENDYFDVGTARSILSADLAEIMGW